MKPHCPASLSRTCAGMTLLEVLVACGILIIGLTGVAAMLPAAASRLSQASTQDRAAAVAAAALAEIQCRRIITSDLFPSGNAVVFGSDFSQVRDATVVGNPPTPKLGVPNSAAFPTRIDATGMTGFFLSDEPEFAEAGGDTPINSFVDGKREFRRGMCWTAFAIPRGTATPVAEASVSVAVRHKPGSTRLITLKQVTPSMFEVPYPTIDEDGRRAFLRPCSQVLAIPESSALPVWVGIASSWPVWAPGVDPQKTTPQSFRVVLEAAAPPALLNAAQELKVIALENLVSVTEQIMRMP